MSETGESRPRLVKLVRDDISRFLDGRNDGVIYQQMSEYQWKQELRKKLLEEAIEYLQNPCQEELADVLEVVQALAKHDLHMHPAELEDVRVAKFAERGGFNQGIGMYVYTTNKADTHV